MNPSGEISIEISGKTYRLRSSFKCLTRIEEVTGVGIVKLLQSMIEGDVRFGRLAHVVHQGILAGEDRMVCPTYDEVGEWLAKGNLAAATKILLPFFQEALSAGPKEL